jgi:formiminoglutamate deiminase
MAWLGGPTLVANVTIEANEGVFTSLTTNPRPGASRLKGVVLPGLVNAHSHAFHRLLRGRTHRQGGDFWLWREHMYEVAASLTPESYERLATAVFIEMALSGITTVGEFHYIHHQMGGAPYDDRNEMGHALIRAARSAGIRISLLDTGYFSAGFEGEPLSPVQTRFSDVTASAWLDRVAQLDAAYDGDDDVVVGLAPHSVRAVPESALVEVADGLPPRTPLHVHVSEQPAENQECLDATSMTPTALLDRVGRSSMPPTSPETTSTSWRLPAPWSAIAPPPNAISPMASARQPTWRRLVCPSASGPIPMQSSTSSKKREVSSCIRAWRLVGVVCSRPTS